jgi:hypothetical protein
MNRHETSMVQTIDDRDSAHDRRTDRTPTFAQRSARPASDRRPALRRVALCDVARCAPLATVIRPQTLHNHDFLTFFKNCCVLRERESREVFHTMLFFFNKNSIYIIKLYNTVADADNASSKSTPKQTAGARKHLSFLVASLVVLV